MGRIAYITANMPYGQQETFILSEMLALHERGTKIVVIPRDRPTVLFNKKAEVLLSDTIGLPLFNSKIATGFIREMLMHPYATVRSIAPVLLRARNAKIALKNLAIIPKAVHLAAVLKRTPVTHIHAHWGSTTSTMGYIISRLTGIPWSFTAHRWDIPENNLLKEKCRTAAFVRVIDEGGSREVKEIVNDSALAEKVRIIHMGVNLSPSKASGASADLFNFICPANLLPKKGHRYLLEACRILAAKGLKFKCLVAGDGPLGEELKHLADDLKLGERVEFVGRLPHERLLGMYERGDVKAVVLPSIVTSHDDKEGIPVSLMEAMANSIPVISTRTGGVPELIGDGSGVMVEERDPKAIAEAIEGLRNNKAFYGSVSRRGREKIESDFNMGGIAEKLMNLFSGREPEGDFR